MSAELSPTITLTAPGTYQGTLRAGNEAGESPALRFDYTVHGSEPTCWIGSAVDPHFESGYDVAVALHNGLPVLAYYDQKLAGPVVSLTVARALRASPQGIPDWRLTRLDSELVHSGPGLALASHSNRLLIAYRDSGQSDLKLATSKIPTPATVADWTFQVVHGEPELPMTGFVRMLANGRPTLTYQVSPPSTGRELWIAVGLVPLLTVPADWSRHRVSPQVHQPSWHDPVIHDGRFAVAYQADQTRGLWLARANVAEPASGGEWTVHQMDVEGPAGAHVDLEVVDGLLVAAYRPSHNLGFRLAQALIPEPATADDWSLLNRGDSIKVIGQMSLRKVGNRLAVAFPDGARQQYVVGWSTTGDASSPWIFQDLRFNILNQEFSHLLVGPDRLLLPVRTVGGMELYEAPLP
ncbi:MAG TPA: hypothetical protein VEI97_02445 [bacterium]|nr:hypothetical protein [bacterium]